ncbi:helix-turn-helix domain-containing protein [Nannocystaceae bacterium ST9]
MLLPNTQMAGWPSLLAIHGPGSASDEHAHHALHLVLARAGTLRVCVGDHQHEVAGVLTPPDLAHAIAAEGATVLLVFVDPESSAGAALSEQLAGQPRWITPDERDAWLADLADAPEVDELAAWARALLVSLGVASASPAKLHPKVRKLVGLLRERPLDADSSLETLAAEVGLSPSRLMHAFTESIGLPLRAYLRWLRVQRAALAITRGVPLARAALEAGFSDAAHMSRTFRDMFGLPPSALASRSQFMQAGPA